ncbi:MAG TPA: prolyl oligopeptidase family serine peptidase, partial [Vicinamibacterales bacterium]|nr:prolyl oligopeptidase family serine peptidase [Vicinamibacterales bacterium]
EFEVEHVALSPDRASLFYSSNQRIRRDIFDETTADNDDIDRRHIWRVPVDGSTRAANLTGGRGAEWMPAPIDSTAVAYIASLGQIPAHVVIHQRNTTTRFTEEITKNLPIGDLVEPRRVTITATDGMEIPGQLFVPRDLKPGERRPAVLFFHGGSRRQMLLAWHYLSYYHNTYAMNQYLASRGYIVLSVNYRSGTGYGLEFREARDYGATGASEFQDVLGAGLYMKNRPDVDPNRIGVYGGSYGGYLTAHALARASDLFAAGVDIHGVHDWNVGIRTFMPNYNPGPEIERRNFLSSPLNFVKGWTSPVLLIHGDDDRNVSFAETVTLAEALRKQGVTFESLVVPDEIHGFLRNESWLRVFQATSDFFDRHLRNRDQGSGIRDQGLGISSDRGFGGAFPHEPIRLVATDVADQRRAEARDTGAAGVTHARVDDAECGRGHQALGERLRFDVAARIEVLLEAAAPEIVEARAEIRQVIVIRHVVLEPVDLGELDGLVERDFGLGGFDGEARIPCAAIGRAEAVSERMPVTEGGVDDGRLWYAEHKLFEADARQHLLRGEQPVVGRGIEREDRLKVRLVIRDIDEDAVPVGPVLRRHEAVCIELTDERDRGECGHSYDAAPFDPRDFARRAGKPARAPSARAPCVEQAPDDVHGRQAAARHVCQRRVAGENRIGVGQAHPLVRETLAMQDVKRLVDADEIRDARQPIGVERAIGIALPLIERPVAEAAEERARILVAHRPARHDVEEGLEGGCRKPRALAACAQISRRVDREARERVVLRQGHSCDS